MSKKKIAVYTAIFGGYDELKLPLHKEINQEADFFCFTDNKDLHSDYYQIIYRDILFDDPRRTARFFKIKGDSVLNNYQYHIWCDGAIQILAPSLQEVLDVLSENDFAVFSHPDRDCIYEEGKICIERGLDHPLTIYQQLKQYAQEGLPRHFGLLESSAYVKRNNDKTKQFAELWWDEISKGSKRDQLSFDYLRWRLDIQTNYYQGNFNNSNLFRSKGHKKKKKVSHTQILRKVIAYIKNGYQNWLRKKYMSKIDQLQV